MKVKKQISPEASRMIRRFSDERARRVKTLDAKLEALKKRAQKIQGVKQQVLSDEQEGFLFVLAPLGFKDEYGQTLSVNTATGEAAWDDGEPEINADDKILEESARELAKGKKRIGSKADAEIIPLEAASKNGG